MKIAHNIAALQSNLNLTKTDKNMFQASSRLSSGLKINTSKDDAAGLSIANTIQTQIRGVDMANRNALDAVSLAQTAEGALSQIENMAQRIRELSTQAANGTLTATDREKALEEVTQLNDEMNAIAQKTQFNGISLLNSVPGNTGGSHTLKIQVGQSKDMEMNFMLERVSASILNLDKVDFSTEQTASASISICDTAIDKISEMRARFGAYQNRLEMTAQNLQSMSENYAKAMSRIKDTDMAKEMTSYTQLQVMSQATTSILSQANQRPQQILQLLH